VTIAERQERLYAGRIAKRLVNGVQAAGGIWTLDDLALYEAIERAPAREYRVENYLIPPPSSGGVALAGMLNILSAFDP
jgi:gamma-glutamyltranspeptidase/glutathione hydrolase